MPEDIQSSGARRWLLLVTVCLTAVLTPLSFTGPAVTIPSIQQTIGGSPGQLHWVLNGYILTFGSLMMAAGSIADTYGRKRAWIYGLIVFIILTFLIPYAGSAVWIAWLRVLQGAASAVAFAGGLSTMAQVFHGSERTRAFSILGTCFGIGLAFGPLVAGWLIDVAGGWQSVFLATGFLSLVSLVLAIFTADDSRDPLATGLDWWGAISFTGFLSLLTFGLLRVPEYGWTDSVVLGSFAATLVLFIAFMVIERRQTRPMLDLSLFESARFVGVQLLGASSAFFYIALIAMLPTRFISVEGYSALEAGQIMIAMTAPLLVVPFVAGVLARWISVGIFSGIGLLIVAAGLALLGYSLKTEGMVQLPMLLIGIGVGLPWGLMDGMALAVTGVLLAALIQRGLADITDSSSLNEAASRAAIGDFAGANFLLPVSEKVLIGSYDAAFSTSLFILSVACVVVALVVFTLLSKERGHD